MAESYSVEAILSVYDKGFTSGMERAGAVARGLSQQSANTGGGILKMGGAFGLATAAASKGMQVISNAMDGAINRFDTLNKYPVVMKALGYSAGDVARSAKLMSNGIDGLPTSLDEITSSAQQLAPLTGSATKAAKSALALNNAFLASGASVADTSRGLQQYTQMLSTGKVDMMSWRTLMETMPIALRKVAKSFGYTGKSAKTDLYDALKKGKISVDDLNNGKTLANTKALLAFMEQVQADTRENVLRGNSNTPKRTGASVKTMTKADIMSIKDDNERQKAIAEHIDLFK